MSQKGGKKSAPRPQNASRDIALGRNPSLESTDASGVPPDGPTGQNSFRVEHTSGDIPPPSMLAGYNEIVENGAERLFRMAERASEDRSKVVRSRARNETMGTVFGFLAFVLFLAVAVWLVTNGYQEIGVVWMILQFGSTIWIRTYGHKTLVDTVRSLQDN